MRRQDKFLVIDNLEIYNYYRERLINLALSQFEWYGLPETCDRLYFERTLLFNGTAAMLKPLGSDFWLTVPYTYSSGRNGMIDVYGYPTQILGYGANAVNIKTDEWKILFDNMTKQSLMPKIDLYAKLLWECHNIFRSNLRQQNTPYVVATTKNEQLSFKNFFNRLFGFEPVITIKNTTNIDDSIKVLDMNKDYIGNDILDSLKSIWNEACRMLGITGETTKKERMLDGELQMNRMQDTITMSSRLLNRVEFCNKMNKDYGLDLSVNLVSADTEFLPYVDPYFDMDGSSKRSYQSTVEKGGNDGEMDNSDNG